MSIFPLTPLKTIFISEFILVFAMAMGIAPQEFSYLILLLLTISFIKLSLLDSLKLFIVSIPFFVALPANAFSDSMSIWRVLIIVLVLKVGWEKKSWLHSPEGLWSRCARLFNNVPQFHSHKETTKSTRLRFSSAVLKRLWSQRRFALRFHRAIATMEPANNKLFFLTILFFIIAALSLIFAQSPVAGIKKMLFLVNIFLLFPVVIYAIKRENDLREILKAVLYALVIIVFIGYFQFISTFFITLSQLWEFWAGNVIKTFYGQNLSHLLSYSNTWFSYYNVLPPTLRIFSVLPDSHSFAMVVIISVPVILSFLFYYQQKNQKKYLSILLITSLLAIFFSGSRGAWVGSVFALMAGLFLYLLSSLKARNLSQFSAEKMRWRDIISEFIKLLKSKVGFGFDMKNNSKYYSKLITFSVLLFFILMPVSSLVLKQNQEAQIMRSNLSLSDYDSGKLSMFERAFSISDFDETSNKGRIQIWQETITSIGKHPFLGVGFGNFNYVLSESSSVLKKGSSAHSIYLDIAAEIGIFGLMIFVFLITEILAMSYKLYFKIEKKYLKIFAGSFFVYFTWICAYSIFDVVIFNDKVLMVVIVLAGVLYSIEGIMKHNFRP